jgi:hypothetical protein
MASYTANQGYRWPALEDLARFLEDHPDDDPVSRPEPLYQRQSDIVYGAAHHAFTFLIRRYGEEPIRGILRAMRQEDLDFPAAFERAVGISADAFVQDFDRYVRLRGFKGGRIPSPSTGRGDS